MFREHAFDAVQQRRLFSLRVSSAAELPNRLPLPRGNFACLLAWNAEGASAAEVSAFVEPLLRAGASYLVCWGSDCERVHDIIDALVSEPGSEFSVPAEACIMTTWHDSEPLCDAIWFFLMNTWPDPHFEDSTHAGLAISVGSTAWASEIENALEDPHEFVRRGAENDGG